MSDKYKTHEADKAYFVTMTDVDWMNNCLTTKFFYEKLNYIHQDPMQDMLVEKAEEYLFSSARNPIAIGC